MKMHSVSATVALAVAFLVPSVSDARNPPRGPDFDCDGLDDMAIGVRYDDETANDHGGVNILYGTASGPTAPNMTTLRFDQDSPAAVEGVAEASDAFGYAIAWGDFDQDGFDDLAIGASHESVNGDDLAGAITILYGSASGLDAAGDQIWHGDSSGISLYDPAHEDYFGNSLAAGDFDGDGHDDLAIGILHGQTGGAVLILYGDSGGLTTTGHQVLDQDTVGMAGDGGEHGDAWSSSLVSGDFDCDGFEDIAVGAPLEQVTSGQSGAVTVIYGTSGGLTTSGSQWWHQNIPNIAGVVGDGDLFGQALAAANFNGDTPTANDRDCVDLAIGAPSDDIEGLQSSNGAVNIIYGGVSGLTTAGNQRLFQGSGLSGSLAQVGPWGVGSSVTVGRFNNDGFDDIATGSEQASPGGVEHAGVVYLAKGTASGFTGTGSVHWDASPADIPGAREFHDRWGSPLSYAAFEGDEGQHYLIASAYWESDQGIVPGAVSTIELNSGTSNLDALGGTEWFQDDIEGTRGDGEEFGAALPAPRLKVRCTM